MQRIGQKFQEFNSDSAVMVVLEGDKPLGDEARHYYDDLVKTTRAGPRHVEHVQNFWGDRITAAGSQSEDGKAAYVQVNLAGNQGETLGTNPWKPCERSSPNHTRQRDSRPTSPGRPRRSPTATKPPTRAW